MPRPVAECRVVGIEGFGGRIGGRELPEKIPRLLIPGFVTPWSLAPQAPLEDGNKPGCRFANEEDGRGRQDVFSITSPGRPVRRKRERHSHRSCSACLLDGLPDGGPTCLTDLQDADRA